MIERGQSFSHLVRDAEAADALGRLSYAFGELQGIIDATVNVLGDSTASHVKHVQESANDYWNDAMGDLTAIIFPGGKE